ncbi:MAG: flagellar hook-basal body complex protein FliE [Gammaproteobacteria bacterium]
MSEVDVSQLLAQMRAMTARAEYAVGPAPASGNPKQVNFAHLLKDSINKVNDTQQQAASLSKSFELGQGQVDLSEVMVALQKANVSFEAMTQVRNKLVSAYQDIMNMSI